jgi:hypothetical protein
MDADRQTDGIDRRMQLGPRIKPGAGWPPQDRPIAAASAPLLRLPHRRALSIWYCRSGRIRSPPSRPSYGKVVPKHRHAINAGNGHVPLSTCRKPPAGLASVPRCQPSIGSRRQTTCCPHRCGHASLPAPEDDPQSDPIARLSASVCSRADSFGNLESELTVTVNPTKWRRRLWRLANMRMNRSLSHASKWNTYRTALTSSL